MQGAASGGAVPRGPVEPGREGSAVRAVSWVRSRQIRCHRCCCCIWAGIFVECGTRSVMHSHGLDVLPSYFRRFDLRPKFQCCVSDSDCANLRNDRYFAFYVKRKVWPK